MNSVFNFRLLLLLLVFPFGMTVSANRSVERSVVGSATDYVVVPELTAPSRSQHGTAQVWTKRIERRGASFLKIHFSDFNLQAGDTLRVTSGTGRVVETLAGKGPKSRIHFWGLSVQGEVMDLRLEYRNDYVKNPPFKIDRIIAGDSVPFEGESVNRAPCFPLDFSEAACYLDDPGMSASIMASAGLITIDYFGEGADALTCSGSNVSANNTLMTNEHCVPDQLTCDDTEYVFNFRKSSCDPESPVLNEWVSFRCDDVLVVSPGPANAVDCALAPGEVDMTLTTVIGDPAAQFGFVELDREPVVSGEDLYIVQHPNLNPQNVNEQIFTPQKVTVGGGADVVVDGDTLRYNNTLDTWPGSSGSPVFRRSSNKVVALHHCSAICWDPDFRGNGALATTIYPLVAQYVCSDTLKLNYGSTGDLAEVVGNGDAIVDPGESWSFTTAAVNNTCAIDGVAVSGEYAVSAASMQSVSIYNDALGFGAISAGSSASDTVTFSVPVAASCGADVLFDLVELKDVGSSVFDSVVEALAVPIGSTPQTIEFSDGFDSGSAAWSVVNGGTGAGPSSTWTDQIPRNSNLAHPYFIADSEVQGAGSVMDEELISPVVDASGYAAITLQFTHDFHFNSNNATMEQGDVEVRSAKTNNQWVVVKTYSGDTYTGTETLDVTPYAAADLQVKFRYYNAEDDYYWAVDDVLVLGDNGAVCSTFNVDTDGDGVVDSLDNCLLVANADQRDTNMDGYGNICDPDLNNDGATNFLDLSLWVPFFLTATTGDFDLDGDGQANFLDYAIIMQFASNGQSPPGPSGVAP